MRPLFGDRNRSLLFRSYLYLVGGLLVVAIVLDLGFGYLQTAPESDVVRWLERTAQLVEAELAALPADERDAAALALSERLGVGVRVLSADDVVMIGGDGRDVVTLVDQDGRTSYLYDAAAIDSILRFGPVSEPTESLLVRLLPPAFYLSIFIVVGVWLRPLLKDINRIADSTQRFAADYRNPTSSADDVTELTGLARNIDDMSARISALLRSQKELIAALSHEMRTPLARIRFALAVIGKEDDPELAEQVEALDTDVQEIDELIASMLNYARLDHPDVRMRWQDVPLANWLQLMVDKASTDGLRIELDTNDCPQSARMDPRLMELALSNLLVNATRYGEERVRCTATRSGDDCMFTVEDDGKGIPETERESVFKAFTRIDDSRNRETGGVGLGLAIVARIAELHGGDARVERSADLGGARFRIRWPSPQ